MTKKMDLTIDELLAQHYLLQGALPDVAEIVKKVRGNKKLKLVYGETYDQFGLTIDSLKYYFFLSLLHRALESAGIKVISTVIVGDLHSVKNKLVANKTALLNQAETRLQFISHIKSVYNLPIEPVLMSQLCSEAAFQKRLATITPLFQNSETLQNMAKKTVLSNRLTQEKTVGFQYTLEEIALITGFDIKVGPPREIYYDQMARELGSKVTNPDFCGLYLKPTYPLGFNFDFFVTHPEIEKFGVTPYKAGSNKLQDHRIVLQETNLVAAQTLLKTSFTAKNLFLPNPVLDIYLIAKLAGYFLTGEPFTLAESELQNVPRLKSNTSELLTTNIYQPLQLN